MADIVEPNKSEYVNLIWDYLAKVIDENSYGTAFQELVQRHLTLQEQQKASWPERYDVQIQQDHASGKITDEEFSKRWTQLWGKHPDWYDIVYVDLVYLGDRRPGSEEILQSFQSDPDEYTRTYFLTEEQFKDELRKYLKKLEDSED